MKFVLTQDFNSFLTKQGRIREADKAHLYATPSSVRLNKLG